MLSHLRTFVTNAQSRIIGFEFLVISIIIGAWASRLPQLQTQLQMDEAMIGGALLSLSLGNIIIAPFSALVLDKLGIRWTTTLSIVIYSIGFTLTTFATVYYTLWILLFIAGLGNTMLGVVANASAASLEKHSNIKIMSSVHGMYSLGGMIGALAGSLCAGFEIAVYLQMTVITLLILGILLISQNTILSIPPIELKGKKFAFHAKSIRIFLAVAVLIVFGEGVVMDWSAIYLGNVLNSNSFLIGLGFAGFALAMTIGRLSGDHFIPRIGVKRILIGGGLLASIGFVIAACTVAPWIAILGFTAVGFGISVIAPILFSASATRPDIAPGTGIATLTTACGIAFLLSRPVTGMIADQWGLQWALWLSAALYLLSSILVLTYKGKMDF